MQSVHDHPKPFLNRVTQIGAALLLLIMLLAALGLIVLGLLDARFRLLIFGGGIVLLLVPFVLMLVTITPPLTVAPDGLTLRPVVGRSRRLSWDAVQAVRDYPLLPPASGEIERRFVTGKKRYRAAEGKMLLIPSLPAYYRFNGLFCGEGFTPVIAFTNRAHADYDKLLKKVLVYTEGQP